MIEPEFREHWTWMPVAEILQTIEDSADFGTIIGYDTPEYRRWVDGEELTDDDRTVFLQRMIAQKSSDPCFGALVESILEHGWQSAISWRPDERYLGNGHHRLVAAILLCADEIPTSHYGSIWSTTQGELDWDAEDEYDEAQIVSWSPALPPNRILVEV